MLLKDRKVKEMRKDEDGMPEQEPNSDYVKAFLINFIMKQKQELEKNMNGRRSLQVVIHHKISFCVELIEKIKKEKF